MCQALSRCTWNNLIHSLNDHNHFSPRTWESFPRHVLRGLDLRQRLQDPCPHLLYRQTPDNDWSSPSLELHTLSSTDAGQSTMLLHRHSKSNSFQIEIFPFVFPVSLSCSTTLAMVGVGMQWSASSLST